MKILLREAVEHLGNAGEFVAVKDGYARNFLIPKGMAVRVTRQNAASIEKEVEMHKAREEKRMQALQESADKIEEANCTVSCRADDNDRLYGSVTQADIAKSLKVSGFEVSPKQIEIDQPIRQIGVHSVRVRFDKKIVAEVKVWVVKE